MEVGQLQLRRDSAAERAPTSLRAKRPQFVGFVVNQRHRERLRGGGEFDRSRVGGAEGHAALAAAQALRLRLPAGDALEFPDRDAGAREDHCGLR